MSTFMLKNNSSNFTLVSNVFIEKYMPKARGEFIKVYLLMLKYNNSGEMGANSTILASTLNLLESDILNALNYWNDEGVIKLIPIDKMGNYNIEFIDLVEDSKSRNKEVNLLEALNKTSTKDMLNDIERLLGRPLSPKEMTTYLSWQEEFNFSSELILILIEYCVSRGKSDYRYIEKVAIAWHDMNITSIDDAQNYIKKTEDKWIKIRHILNYLGIKNPEITENAGNEQSMVVKFDTGKTTFLVLGDTGIKSSEKLLKTQKEKLKSDIVQMAHHGQSGATKELYEQINPTICMWPTPEWLWNNDSGEGKGSGPWKTLETRQWMEELKVKKNYVEKDGDIVIKLK